MLQKYNNVSNIFLMCVLVLTIMKNLRFCHQTVSQVVSYLDS